MNLAVDALCVDAEAVDADVLLEDLPDFVGVAGVGEGAGEDGFQLVWDFVKRRAYIVQGAGGEGGFQFIER
jgi:hypothetical protein